MKNHFLPNILTEIKLEGLCEHCNHIGVIASMLTWSADGPGIDTQSGTFSGNHYFNGLLSFSVVLFTAKCTCILPREMGSL